MKKIALIILALISIQCKAQNPIVNLTDRQGKRIAGTYYKDINNILTPFEGTWLYSNGTTSLKIVLVKKINRYFGNFYEDLLIGEFRYVENNIEKFNSLNNLNALLPDEYRHKIAGNFIPTTTTPFDEYTPGEIRVKLFFDDNRGGTIEVRKTIVNGQEAIQIWRYCGVDYVEHGEVLPTQIVPDGIYTLLKQP